MTPKQKERFAKFYVSKILEEKEQLLWFRRITDPESYRLYKESLKITAASEFDASLQKQRKL